MNRKHLFVPTVDPNKLHPLYEAILGRSGYAAARAIMEEVFLDFHDGDGNFLEQFQTTGFNARIFELYLFAYFSRSGFRVNQDYNRPDFLIGCDGQEIAVEVTTINPSSNPSFSQNSNSDENFSETGLRNSQLQELPIRFGSSLFSKLKKKYWDLPHVKGRPLVVAIQAFHDDDALFFSSFSLSVYLYGLHPLVSRTVNGSLIIQSKVVETHKIGTKEIPSNFFAQPDTENISAVLFTNSGTAPKFLRMGFQEGHHKGDVRIQVIGSFYDPDPDADIPKSVAYDLDNPPFTETWGQGLEVFYNSNALHPLPRDFFPDAAQHYIQDGRLYSDMPLNPPHPITSATSVLEITDKVPIPKNIEKISRRDFEATFGQSRNLAIAAEMEWYRTVDKSYLGIILQDYIDKDYVYVILQYSDKEIYQPIETIVDIESISSARANLFAAFEKISGNT